MENQNPFTVEEVERRMVATQEELQTVETSLAAIPARRELLLGAETFDEAALAHLEEEESSLTRKQEYLKRRLPVLEKHRETEEAKAARERITGTLVPETHALREKYDTTLAAFWKTATTLEHTANKLVDLYQDIQTRHDEQEWIVERYKAFQLERVPLSEPGQMPDEVEVSKQIFQTLKHLRLTWNSARGNTPWAQKLADWQKSQQKLDTWQTSPVRKVA